jgi:hypothetical protein
VRMPMAATMMMIVVVVMMVMMIVRVVRGQTLLRQIRTCYFRKIFCIALPFASSSISLSK